MYDEWVYYSTLVDGYVEKYSMRGMRERNRKLLKALKQQDGSPEARKTRESLIENNLPFAKYVAERYGNRRGWSKEKKEDAYQDCCYALVEYINELNGKDKNENFSRRIYISMLSEVTSVNKCKIPENLFEFIRFDENDFPQEQIPEILKYEQTTTDMILGLLNRRSQELFIRFFWGDPENYVEPQNLEDIAFHMNLTRERVRQIKEKNLKNLRKYLTAQLANPKFLYTKEDFVINDSI